MGIREEFEAWVLREYPNQHMGQFANGECHSTTIQHCWLSWQASRESLVVELPDEEPGYMYYAPHMVAALEAAGVRIKP